MSDTGPGGPPPRARDSSERDPGPEGLAPGPQARSLGPAALIIAVLAGVALFVAGLNLGGGPGGGGADERRALEPFMEAYQRITRQYVGEVEPGELVEAAIEGMFESLDDPYSSFMSGDQFDADLAVISGEFEGIGARMNAQDADSRPCAPLGEGCELRIVDVLDDSPAEMAGLQGGDVVTSIDEAPTAGLTMEDAITLIRGPRDSQVVLAIRRDEQVIELAVTRDVIRSQDVRSALLADGRVGYLRVDAFTGNAQEDFRDQLGVLLDAGVEGIVVDVRGDPGGFVEAAVAMASQFLATGPIMWEEDATGSQRAVEAASGGLATDSAIEVAVLVDGGSASASEILAGALRDRGRATIVGQTTFGKGTIQEWTDLPGDGGGFRLSVAKWLTPDRTWIDGVGIVPDVVVRPGADDPPAGGEVDILRDAQLREAVETLLGEPVDGGSTGATDRSPADSPDDSPVASPAG